MFTLTVKKNIATLSQQESVTSGSVNAYLIDFDLSEEWDDLTATAVFKTGNAVYHKILDESRSCFIPWEVMVSPKVSISIGVYGTRGEDVVLPTTWATSNLILEGVVLGDEVREPSPDVYAQILQQIKELQESVDKIEPGGGGGVAFTVDSTLTMDKDNVLSVSVPVIPTTKMKYEALTEEEKQADCIYVVEDEDAPSPSTSTPWEIYSTEEIPIGTWIDGRTIYRKVIQTTAPSTIKAATNIADVSDLKIDKLVRFEGYIYFGNQIGVINMGETMSTNVLNYVITDIYTNYVRMNIGMTHYVNKPVELVLEYTKKEGA